MKLYLGADLVIPGDSMIHPRDGRPHHVTGVHHAINHADYIDIEFADIHEVSLWKTEHIEIVRHLVWEKA